MLQRRQLLTRLTALSFATPVLSRAIVAAADDDGELSIESLAEAQWITGIELTEEQQQEIIGSVKQHAAQMGTLRATPVRELQGPAFHFQPLQTRFKNVATLDREIELTESEPISLPDSDEQIAFLPVTELARLLKTKKLTSKRLTEIYVARLKKYGGMLRCVISLLEESALRRADEMDAELAAGKYRGPLHGIPWGAKDLIDIEGTKTSWGIPHYRDRDSESTATVARRLDEAGAVLVAKLSLGALAMGDRWFGGMTRNPWNPKTGSSGSSAGSASSAVAGLVGFTLGSETLGSITTPSRICGASGFRPTFGRVSRDGCMPLSWTMDKIGPICRSAEDCAIVFNAIHGADGRDATAVNHRFDWTGQVDMQTIRVGYRPGRSIEKSTTLSTLSEMGCQLVEFEMPKFDGLRALTSVIDVEAASVFDGLLRAGHVEGWNSWTKTFRSAGYISAVDYLRLQRMRVDLMHAFEEKMSAVDVLVNVNEIVETNLTGHPAIVVPTRYRDRKSSGKFPVSSRFTGQLYDDDRLLAIAHQFQLKNGSHLQHPTLDPWLEKFAAGELDG